MIHSFDFPKTITSTEAHAELYKLQLTRREGDFFSTMGFSNNVYSDLHTSKEAFLHPLELEQFSKLLYERKKQSFLQGRFLAKKVLANYLDEKDHQRIVIKSGIFGQPLVCYATSEKPAISMAHTHEYAVVLAFPEEHPMGIDIETITPDAKENIGSQLTYFERSLNSTLGEDDAIFYTRLWTIKEALSKVLKTGLMVPMEIYEINSMAIMSDKGSAHSTFTNFTQYKAFSFIRKNTVCSVVLPRETTICSIIPQSI
ncbi:4'-phosphopantetheinyl transferase superfamily protein [Rhodocytophaga aerolata]|uniref:4'-phosphopantetheinyl transferase superfamily protein n=1 Tax=Rhodocytophaga aerolata TaxID=455078 RepID=A0ABT8RAA1_9BACT|nr:4'-phosphopantetheinyl transferase superfamily protein [Rhodocytophaga aerolata]MDO1449030.1 4'-phosphopantetheinyl transferase superfamily protein [Rhodocytophaga aerolata]